MAKLYFRYGAMNSGKTALLLQAAHNYVERGMEVLIVKPTIDSNGDDHLVSRIGLTRKVDKLLAPKDDIFKYVKKLKRNIKCVLVDEAQFLEKEQVDELMHIVVKFNIPVICYGLRSDFKTNGFPGSTRLLELAHTIEEMKTICSCGRKAMFNARKLNGKFIFDGEQVAIDGEAKVTYEALCPNCYYEQIDKYNKNK